MNIKKCPKCSRENPVAANFCRHCGYEFSEESKQGKVMQPIIKDFEVMTDSYTIGSFVDIMWDVTNATHISLNGVNVTNHDSYEYEVKGDDNLVLVASNDYMQTEKVVKLSPTPLPNIFKFTPSRGKVKVGEEIDIHIDYKNSKRAFLLSNLSERIDVSGKKVAKVTPKFGEMYTLICYSIDSEVSITKDLNLTVIDDVQIDAFISDKNRTIEGVPIMLSWKVRNAQTVMLYPDGIDVTRITSIELLPSRTMTYRLEATNGLDVKSELLCISVIPIPRLTYKMPELPSLGNLDIFDLIMKDMLANIREIAIDEWLKSPLETTKVSVFKQIKKCFTSMVKLKFKKWVIV